MAIATRSSGAALVKAVVVLPLILALLAVAAGASSVEDGPAVAESGGRFSETPVGRKLLGLNLCLPNCTTLLPLAYNPKCCTDLAGTQACFDVGAYDFFKCGSCNTTCKFGEVCCKGVCTKLLTDKNNCGICGNKCRGSCIYGICNY